MGNSLSFGANKDKTKKPEVVEESNSSNNSGDESENDETQKVSESFLYDLKTPPEPSPNVSYWDNTPAPTTGTNFNPLVDPRSPNEGISRTPILISEKEGKKKRGVRENLDVNGSGTNKITTPEPSGLLFDPRSPTQEISRTPIVLSTQKSNIMIIDNTTTTDKESMDEQNVIDLEVAKISINETVSMPTNQMCRDLRKKLFINQKLNESTDLVDLNKENSN